jgi:hypothetical protein
MEKREIIAVGTIIFHFIITFLFIFLPLFIPLETWPTRPLWHFLIMLIIMIIGVITGGYYKIKYKTKKRFICFLNLITQRIRGYNYNDSKNYEYSHGMEVFKIIGINLPKGFTVIVIYIIFVISLINLIIYLF